MVVDKLGNSTSHTSRSRIRIGRYQAVPVTLPDGTIDYILIDAQGRLVNTPIGFCQENNPHELEMSHTVPSAGVAAYNLRMAHSRGIKTMAVTSPGVAYINGTNALCLAAPSIDTNEIEIESIYLATKVAGDFYLVDDNLGVTPGNTTANTFDLVGIHGDDVTDTCDVLWASFLANLGRGATSGDFHHDLAVGRELYLIAPDVVYSLVVSYIEEYMAP